MNQNNQSRLWKAKEQHDSSERFTRFAIGAFAGCIATGPMTVLMALLQRLLPGHERYDLPPSQITTRVLEESGLNTHLSEPAHTLLTAAAHVAYGGAGGVLYAPLAPYLPFPPVVRGALFGVLVWLVSYLGWLPALGILPPATHHPARRNALMIAAHIVWGATLGYVFATRAHEQ